MEKKNLRAPLLACLLVGTFTLGAAAATGAQRISAMLRPDITVKLDGTVQAMYDKNDARVYPIEYNGTTYLPIRSLGTLLGQEVVWDAQSQTVSLFTKTETAPDELTKAALSVRMTRLENSCTTLYSDLSDTEKAATYAENLTIYYRLNNRRASLQEDIRGLRVDISEGYRLDKLTQSERTELENKITSLDKKLIELHDTMLRKFGVDINAQTAKTLRAEAAALSQDQKALEVQIASAEKAANYADWKSRDAAARTAWRTLRDDITALQLAINESLRQSAVSAAEYSELTHSADLLDSACKSFKTRLDKAENAWKGESKPDTGLTDQDAESYSVMIAQVQKDADALFAKCRDYFTDKSRSRADGLALLKEVDSLDRRIDSLEDLIEDSGKLGRQTAWELLRKLDKADDTLDKADDFLEKAGIDDDYEKDHDRGRHNGYDNRHDD